MPTSQNQAQAQPKLPYRTTGTDGKPAWLITRYDEVRQALADPRLSLDKSNALPGMYSGLSLPPALDVNLLNMDPPDHTRIRKLVTKAFTAGRVEQLREPIHQIANDLLDDLVTKDHADLVGEFAAPLPIMVICDLLGIPAEDRTDFRAWTDALVAPDPAKPQQAKEAIGAMMRFYPALIARKRAEPGDDLLTAMIAARDEDDRLSEDELTSLAFLILFAGYENVVHLIGNAILGLLDNPEQLKALQAERSLLPAAIEEFARYDGPAPLAVRRFPLSDVEIGGVTIPQGETVLLSLGGANHDPSRFAEPERLDLRRNATGHLALGHGIHYCVGAPLARLETEMALAAVLDRLPALALAVPRDEIRWRPSMRTRGLLALPVTYGKSGKTERPGP
ncbi:cytochrome P450 [Kribbella sp. NBC_01245]|uniref:cytochrome P450 family protein n=1 Tax=Kribbella sp. NBC_01245 TaxID=2903578 RepID=UPI002E2B84A9|nr:cytochrome P450 [Kribbella sp. NBC_01245]